MTNFCDCPDWKDISIKNPDLFRWDNDYGWVLSWIELDKRKNHSNIHRYGLSIHYCPLCGKELEKSLKGRGNNGTSGERDRC